MKNTLRRNAMKGGKFLHGTLLVLLELFLALACMAINSQAASPLVSSPTSTSDKETGFQIASKAKQALIVIFPFFGEQPYSETRSVLENKGVKVLVASSSVDLLPGYEKKLTVKPDMLLSQVRTSEYDAIVFIWGARYEGDNADAIRIAKEGAAEGKVLASYATAVSTLIKADVLNGKRVSAPSEYSSFVQKAGATISTAPVEQDGKIITSTSQVPQKFAEAIAAALTAGAN
jgi:putative intracellular protease/amidase